MIAKSLNFGSGIQEEGEKGPLVNVMPLDALLSSRPPASMIPAFVPVAANIMSQGIREGNVCKVQVCSCD